MKNVLSYYYNLYSDEIRLNGENYYFKSNNENYVLFLYKNAIPKLQETYNLYLEAIKMGIYSHQIILNRNNQLLTEYNDRKYILMKLYEDLSKKIDMKDIIYFGNVTGKFDGDNAWKKLWSNKIDYFEYQISQIGKKYPLIRKSFPYYAGIVENGICLLNRKYSGKCSIAHKRMAETDSLFEFYNPLNYIIDIKVRDSAEFFKSMLFREEDVLENIKIYIETAHLTEDELYYFFIRMLYPSFYFDLYEQIVENKLEESKIKEAIKITPIYEKLIKKLYQYLKNIIQLPEIDWLEII